MMPQRSEWKIPFTFFIVTLFLMGMLYFASNSLYIRSGSLFFSGIIVFSGVIYAYSSLRSPLHLLQRKMSTMSKLLYTGSGEEIMAVYDQMLKGYLILSPQEKKWIDSKLNSLCDRVEEQFKAKKKIELLMHSANNESTNSKGIQEKRRKYDLAYAYFQLLPAGVQKEYYPHIVHMREELESDEKRSDEKSHALS